MRWAGHINHAPPSRCNVTFEAQTVIQLRSIYQGQQLFVDNGVDYWLNKATGRDRA